MSGDFGLSGTGRSGPDIQQRLADFLSRRGEELRDFREQLHMHPETAHNEHQTTSVIFDMLCEAGLRPQRLPHGTGLVCDVGPANSELIALRADIDALPIQDAKGEDVPYRSRVEGVAHACGHDVHTTVVLGVGLFLAELAKAGMFNGGVRLLFQPAEEAARDGALKVIEAGGLENVRRVFALHCDPSLRVGRVGLVTGPITASYDLVRVHFRGPGGHTARPHKTGSPLAAAFKAGSDLPALLQRRIDPRAGYVLEWSRCNAGTADNVIPRDASLVGSLRCLDPGTREEAPKVLQEGVSSIARMHGVEATLEIERRIPPTVNDEECIEILRTAVGEALGNGAAVPTEQSLGGEDFGQYSARTRVKAALARLGVAAPGEEGLRDLHHGDFDVHEDTIPTGVRVLTWAALLAHAV